MTRINPYRLCRVGDAGDVPFTRAYEVEETLNDITRFFTQLYEADVVPLAAGGDHSVTLAILRAMIVDGPIGMVHIDAHTDTWDEFMGCKFMHGTPFRRAVEKNLIDPGRTVQIGIRGAQTKQKGGITPSTAVCASFSWTSFENRCGCGDRRNPSGHR